MRNGTRRRRGWGVAACLIAPLFLASCTSKQPVPSTPSANPPTAQQVPVADPSKDGSKAEPGKTSADASQTVTDSLCRQMPKGLKPIPMNLKGEELEQTCDAMCAQIAEIIKNRNFSATEWTSYAERMFPEMKLVWRIFNHTATPEEIAADPESELVYKYLLSSDERIQYTMQSLASFVCWGRLDRVWFALFENPASSPMVEWGKCPLEGLPYVADTSQVSCPQHGISFTFPDHNARPQIDQLMLQFISGDFTAKHRHVLDDEILKEKASAVQLGETVADIGCGVGGFTLTMAQGVGPNGRVFATDINDDVLNFVGFACKESNFDNVTTYKVSTVDPGLRPATLDRAFMIDVINEVAGPELASHQPLSPRCERYLKKVCEALKPGAKLTVVDDKASFENSQASVHTVSECLRNLGLQETEWHGLVVQNRMMFVLTMQKPLVEPANP